MKDTTNKKGDTAVFKVLLESSNKGYIASKPMSESARYDLILDHNGRLYRTQIKYADGISGHSEGVVRVCLEKVYKNKTLRYGDDIDLLLVYIPKIEKICAFKSDIFNGKSNLYIRYEQAKNKQKNGCLFAEEYLW